MLKYYVIDIKTGHEIWVENKEKAIALVNSYAKLSRSAEYIEAHEDFDGIPF